MKSTGERHIPSDPELPALGELFPGAAPLGAVDSALAHLAPDARLDALDISYVRYRPGKSCVVLWTRGDPQARAIVASGRVSHNDRAERLLTRTANQPLLQLAAADTGPGFQYFEHQRLLVQRFPLDLRLEELTLKRVPALLAQKHTVQGRGPDIATVAISYKPWRRCVCRYDVAGPGGTSSYFGKLFRDDQAGFLAECHVEVQETLARLDAPWSVPQVYDCFDEARTLLFHAFDSATEVRRMLRPARKTARAKQRLLSHIRSAAEGLAAFQKAEPNGLRRETPADLVASFRHSSSGIMTVAPDLGRSVHNALAALDAAACRLPRENLVTAHGAFRHDQLVEASGRLIVLDLDTICLSGASADAGNFLGYLDLTAIRRPRLQDIISDCESAFIAALGRKRTDDDRWLAWYRAAAHVKKALRAFFSLEPGWPETTAQLFELSALTLRRTGV